MPAEYDLITLVNTVNVAENLDEDVLNEMGETVVNAYEMDKASRSDWEESYNETLKLATQVFEEKTFPWKGAANVKYPLLTTAAIQFHARAFPALIKDDAPVKPKVIGPDPQGLKSARALRVSTYLNWKLMNKMEEWVEDMDRLLIVLPILGTVYKKLYFSTKSLREKTELVLPFDLIINYNATDFKRARKTHVIYMDDNEVMEYMRAGVFTEQDLGPAESKQKEDAEESSVGISDMTTGEDNPRQLLEQHTWWDIDGDGYKEPYIITVDYDSGKVLRVVARWNQSGVSTTEKGKIISIDPIEYFIKYSFVPNPASKIYDLGFGGLLGPLNEAVNTLTNQLLDAGTLSNLQGGFLGKGIRLKGGVMKMSPGEWKVVQSTGDDLRKNIFPLPFKEPSQSLFSLLQLLITSGERLSSVTDVMIGENPGQNQPYATTAAVLEQGLKVFTGVYKRIYRSLQKEFNLLYKLTGDYINIAEYSNILSIPEDVDPQSMINDFMSTDNNIIPAADPAYVPDTLKLARAQSLFEKMVNGLPVNPQIVAARVLEAEGHENIEQLMDVPDTPPPMELQLKMEELQHKKTYDMAKLELEAATLEYESMKDVAMSVAHIARARAMNEKVDLDEYTAITDRMRMQEESVNSRLKVLNDYVGGARKDENEKTKLENDKNRPTNAKNRPANKSK